MDDSIIKLRGLIGNAKRIVFFGGAGVSTESSIPDFRGKDGLYKARNEFGLSPETLLSHEFFVRHPDVFYKYYRSTLSKTGYLPNKAHYALAKLEAEGKLTAVITQNVDNLHQMAGSKHVIELHGSAYRNYCTKCGKSYSIDFINSYDGVPKCDCGAIVRPDVVLYGEQLDYDAIDEAIEELRSADLLIVGGTSLVVYPAAGLIDYYSGDELVLINKGETSYDSRASLVLHRSIGEVLSQAVDI
ncbi:MAG: NAD-dependent protein deacylase [Clostridiales bacterium]|nr:NAD-dependent protein deacylase [Clostridiales bacterium]MDD7550617.1 NAD-dependent protein deacylase [Clostridia bacterium]MDY5754167.1 NAD-dependent protein deacylase [Eubacteriales bacterium]